MCKDAVQSLPMHDEDLVCIQLCKPLCLKSGVTLNLRKSLMSRPHRSQPRTFNPSNLVHQYISSHEETIVCSLTFIQSNVLCDLDVKGWKLDQGHSWNIVMSRATMLPSS